MAKWTPEHPELAWHIWGRAGCTIPHILAAQFGYAGSGLMGILFALGTVLCVGGLLRDKGPRIAAIGMLATGLSPHFLILSDEVMTEVICAFALALGLLLWQRGKIAWACLTLSWTATTRMEGMPLLILFAVFLTGIFLQQGPRNGKRILRLSWHIFLLGLGPLVWNIALLIIDNHWPTGFRDAIPLIFKNHFVTKVEQTYGAGNWYKFVAGAHKIHGTLFVLPIIVGLGALWRRGHRMAVSYFITFYVIQSALWAGGLFQTGGYYRFFASIAPLGGLAAAYGCQTLSSFRPVQFVGRIPGVIPLTLIFMVCQPVSQSFWHQAWSADNYSAMKEATDAIEARGAKEPGRLVVTNLPAVAMWLDLDLFDKSKVLFQSEITDPQQFPVGTLFLYSINRPSALKDLFPFFQRPFPTTLEERVRTNTPPLDERPWYAPQLLVSHSGIDLIGDWSRYNNDRGRGLRFLGDWVDGPVEIAIRHGFVYRAKGPDIEAPYPEWVYAFERVSSPGDEPKTK